MIINTLKTKKRKEMINMKEIIYNYDNLEER